MMIIRKAAGLDTLWICGISSPKYILCTSTTLLSAGLIAHREVELLVYIPVATTVSSNRFGTITSIALVGGGETTTFASLQQGRLLRVVACDTCWRVNKTV
jgi:hypothetical protein